MRTSNSFEGFGAVDIQADLDGWSATIPGGYKPAAAAWVVPLMVASSLLFAASLVAAGGALMWLLCWVPVVMLYGGVKHALRARRSTRLEVSHGDLRIQPRHMGRDAGAPLEVSLASAPTVQIRGSVGLQEMTIGPHTFPVHAAAKDLVAVVEMLNESASLAQQAGEQAPIPAALKALLSQPTPG